MAILTIPLTFIIALLPALIWLLLFTREDLHPEPKRLLFYTFSVGAIISLPVLVSQLLFQNLLLSPFENILVIIISLAFIEEFFKFIAAYWAVNNHPAFDEPIDAMIYMIAAALGFATVENIFIISTTLNSFNLADITQTISTISLRLIGATLLHALASALVGYYWALGILRKSLFSYVTIGIILATLIHAVFNYLVLSFQENLLIYPSLFLLTAAFFIFNDFEKLKTKS